MNMAATFPAETSARFYLFARRRFGVTCSTLFHETHVTVSSETAKSRWVTFKQTSRTVELT